MLKKIIILSTVSLIIISVNFTLPLILKNQLNKKINNTKGINGHIDHVDLSIIRGAYQIHGLTLYLQQVPTDKPNIYIEQIDLSILWSAILNGKIVAEVDIKNGELTFTDERAVNNDVNEQVKDPDVWISLIDLASPISIDKVNLDNITTTLIMNSGDQIQSNYVDGINGEITNITNSREFTGNKITSFDIQGKLMSRADIILYGFIDPESPKPTFDINMEMTALNVTELDSMINFYAPFDIEQGEVDVALEIAATNGTVNGYVKAGIYNADIFKWKEDITEDNDGIITGMFEGIIDGLSTIFESGKREVIAVKVPITGTLEKTKVSTWSTITSLFHNAFINTYKIEIDDSINLQGDKLHSNDNHKLGTTSATEPEYLNK
ncbi:DUF748 domain-containing protein [Pseudocolwellia sp. AS88]|uniref:DUF748 domain-containing protein n=1 Tax=Pseudocolwellia sp. AS88 TaxID=3063958 RepID=UPI0026F312D1|nr:DUF748 domain-containing protein [Pseudocolwellia sp. AS88]MDO7085196.1 DUF748 domain-containing protein [Pseudocolwellia sp. AS88]